MNKIHTIEVNGNKIDFNDPRVNGREILTKAQKVPVECFSLYLKKQGCDFERISLDEQVDISDKRVEKFVTKEPEVFNYTVNDEPEMTDQSSLMPDQILKLAAISEKEFYRVQVFPDGTKQDYAFAPHEPIKMVCTGMKFITECWLDTVNIEEYGKHCREVPPARVYEIRIDKITHPWEERYITGGQIIELSKKQPVSAFTVLKFTNNHPKPQKVEPGEKVDLREKCLIRFVVQPKTQDDGREVRRQFKLPAADIEFLNKLGLEWETVFNNNHWLIIYDYPIPAGYNVTKANIALLIPAQYDAAQIDMAYFYPHLNKQSGRGINNVSGLLIEGKNFQQWSRHRKPGEWVPGVDNIATHLSLVDNWLLTDLTR